ncbi:MAG: cell division protein FtsL [Candidatus Pacebacteria bacterium]|nr:cell division protein FtsL [Candidatus Paceibacterota bacterium]
MTKGKLKKFWRVSIFIVILLGGLYIFQVSNLTFYAYQLTLLKKEAKTLDEENSSLQLELTSRHPLFRIEELAKDLNFEKISQIQYIKAEEGPVVVK